MELYRIDKIHDHVNFEFSNSPALGYLLGFTDENTLFVNVHHDLVGDRGMLIVKCNVNRPC